MAKSQGLSDGLIQMLSDADKRKGFPPGTMYAIMKQETGGQDKYIADPSAYHYGLNTDGKRIAGHTGKVSTAFGPFGILESTGAKPGYGVEPLKDKSIGEQIRFASDYLDGRSKSAGSLHAGMAGYGEGTKYADQVMNRRDRTPLPVATARLPAQVAMAPEIAAIAAQPQAAPIPVPVLQEAQQVVAQAPAQETDPWAAFQAQQQQRAPVQVADLGFGQPAPINVPDFMADIGKAPEQQVAWGAPARAAKAGSKYASLMKTLIG